MCFATKLKEVKQQLTSAEMAKAVSPLLSRRTVENWLAGRNKPPVWAQEWILESIAKAAK
jgi:hypothetical protein